MSGTIKPELDALAIMEEMHRNMTSGENHITRSTKIVEGRECSKVLSPA